MVVFKAIKVTMMASDKAVRGSPITVIRRDLMNICLDRKHFGADVTLPVFGGATGSDTHKALQQIQVQHCVIGSSSNEALSFC